MYCFSKGGKPVMKNFRILSTFLLLIASLLTSCNNLQAIKSQLATGTGTPNDPNVEDTEIQSETLQSDTAYEPAVISGAYLACLYDDENSVIRCSYSKDNGAIVDISPGTSFNVYSFISEQKGDLIGEVNVSSVQTFFELPVSNPRSLPPAVLVDMIFSKQLMHTGTATLAIKADPGPPAQQTPTQPPVGLTCAAPAFPTNGYCFRYGAVGANCTDTCSSYGGVNVDGTKWANRTMAICNMIFDGLKAPTYNRGIRPIRLATAVALNAGGNTGCTVENDNSNGGGNAAGRWIVTYVPANYPYALGSEASASRACACQN